MIAPIYNRDYFKDRSEDLKNQHLIDIIDLISFFKTQFNLQLYINYGTLLGAIRGHDFIAEDKDIDLSYMSNQNTIDDIKIELLYIIEKLNQTNMLVKNFNNRGQLHVKVPNGSLVVDVFTSWIFNSRYYLVPFGEIGTVNLVYPFKMWLFKNYYFQVPAKSEIILDTLYKDWKNPIPKTDNYLKLPKRNLLK